LNDYVRLAECGETVLVIERDRVVARLVPPQQPGQPEISDEFLARGAQEGWLTRSTIDKNTPLPARHPVMTFDQLMRHLEQDREER
jgi:antitoxin (DNA-binding transcriptional repressor) of toxin-antitoxin stability system